MGREEQGKEKPRWAVRRRRSGAWEGEWKGKGEGNRERGEGGRGGDGGRVGAVE